MRAIAAPLNTPDALGRFSAHSFDAVKSLRVRCTAYVDQTIGTQEKRYVASAQIEFRRPDLIRADGTDQFGQTFAFIATSNRIAVLKHGVWHKSSTVEDVISYFAGTAQWTATTVPALLFHTSWGYPYIPGRYTKRAGTEVIGGSTAYRISRTMKGGVEIFWIDQWNGLLVQEQVQLALSAISRMTVTRVYNYQSINGKIPASVFAMPK